MLLSVATFVIAALASLALTYAFMRSVEGRGPVATENHRTMHAGRVPVGGGAPLLLAAVIVAALLWPLAGAYAFLLPAAAALAVVSWMDDAGEVSPVIRFGMHIAAAVACFAALPADAFVFQGLLPLWLDRLIAGLALVWFINLFNFMDGIDGIAGGETIAIAAGYAIVSALQPDAPPLMGLAIALAGAAVGFLFWNWAPARIFMGDVGAVPIGFLLGALMIDLAVRQSLAAAIILPMYFAADATLTLARRIKRGEKPWEAHRSHWYQRAARGLGSHAAVVWRISIVNAVLIVLALMSLSAPLLSIVCAVALVGGLLLNLEVAARDEALTASSAK